MEIQINYPKLGSTITFPIEDIVEVKTYPRYAQIKRLTEFDHVLKDHGTGESELYWSPYVDKDDLTNLDGQLSVECWEYLTRLFPIEYKIYEIS